MVAVAAAAVIAVVELGRAVSSSWPLPARSEELQSASQAFFEPNETSYTPSAIVEYNNSKPSIMRLNGHRLWAHEKEIAFGSGRLRP